MGLTPMEKFEGGNEWSVKVIKEEWDGIDGID